jgi:hypothetical protein
MDKVLASACEYGYHQHCDGVAQVEPREYECCECKCHEGTEVDDERLDYSTPTIDYGAADAD